MGTNIYLQSDFQEEYDKYLHDPMGKIRWKRLSKGGRNRRDIFKLLEEYVGSVGGMIDHVVPHGTVKELCDKYQEQKVVNGKTEWNYTWDKLGLQHHFNEVVIYTDEMAHRGEGKIIEYVENAIITHPDYYASVLLSDTSSIYPTSISYRNLYIGNQMFKLTYQSLTDDWRSNCGYVNVTYEGKDKVSLAFTEKEGTHITTPIFAFDYIKVKVGTSQYPEGGAENFYLDFNEAPGIPEEVVICEYGHEKYGELVSFYDIISEKEIAEKIEKYLQSENK